MKMFWTAEEIKQTIDIMMEYHDPSERCERCRSFYRIYDPDDTEGGCGCQESEFNTSGHVDCNGWCMEFVEGIPLCCPIGKNINDFIVENHEYFNGDE